MNTISIKEIFKISFIYSLIFILFTDFLKKSYFILFNIQSIQEINIITNIFFDTFTHMIIFIIILIVAHNKYKKNKTNTFYGILTITALIIILSYIIKYFNDSFFYHLNELIHEPNKGKTKSTGLLSLLNNMSSLFNKGNFSPFYDLILNPLNGIQASIKLFNFNVFILTVLNSKIIISIITIYYESLFLIFKKLNISGYKATIPIINNLTLIKIANKPIWWIALILIPFVRLIPKYYINLVIAKKFKKNMFAFGMTFISFYFYGLLGFNNSKKLIE